LQRATARGDLSVSAGARGELIFGSTVGTRGSMREVPTKGEQEILREKLSLREDIGVVAEEALGRRG